MPIPKPGKNESKKKFIDRCMGDSTMNGEYPDNKQRYAICNTQWKNKNKKDLGDMDEKRYFTGEIRVKHGHDDKMPRFEGMAIRYNSWSQDLGGFREIIKPGSAKKALKSSDCRALINHNSNLVLGRSVPGRDNNTLRLKETEKGVEFSVDVPDTQAARDLMVSVERGDIDQCSFCFRIAEGGEEWKEKNDNSLIERTITEFSRISDVSIVTFPAYEDTSVALRKLEEYRDNRDAEKENVESEDHVCPNCGHRETETPKNADAEGNPEPENEYDAGKLGLMKKKLDLKTK